MKMELAVSSTPFTAAGSEEVSRSHSSGSRPRHRAGKSCPLISVRASDSWALTGDGADSMSDVMSPLTCSCGMWKVESGEK